MLRLLRDWANSLKRDVAALWLAARDRRVPLAAKWVAALVVAYALSPIDLIPDFIPVLGLIDDLLLLPLGIWLVKAMIPPALLAELREEARELALSRSPIGGALVVAAWVALALAAAFAWRAWAAA